MSDKNTEPKEVQKIRQARKENQRKRQVRASALAVAEDLHGDDPSVIRAKKTVVDAGAVCEKAQLVLLEKRRIENDARVSYEKALEPFIDKKYRTAD